MTTELLHGLDLEKMLREIEEKKIAKLKKLGLDDDEIREYMNRTDI